MILDPSDHNVLIGISLGIPHYSNTWVILFHLRLNLRIFLDVLAFEDQQWFTARFTVSVHKKLKSGLSLIPSRSSCLYPYSLFSFEVIAVSIKKLISN